MRLGAMLDESLTEVEIHWFVARYGTDESVVSPDFLPHAFFPKEIILCLEPWYNQDVQNRLPGDAVKLIVATGRVLRCFSCNDKCPGH